MAKKGKPASVSLQQAVSELECEVRRLAELESDPMLRAILAGRVDLSIPEIADSIEKNFLKGKVFYDSNGAPDPARSTISKNELLRFLNFIRRSLQETKTLYLAQHNAESPVKGEQAYFDLSYWSEVARDVGGVSDWNYWSKLKYLTPIEASCLLVELDLDSYTNIKTLNTPQVSELGKYVDGLKRHAERDNEEKKLSPAKWIEWAQGKGYAVPEKFVDVAALYETVKPMKKSASAKKLESDVRDFKRMYEERCKQKQEQPYPIPATKNQFKDCFVRVMKNGAYITPETLHDNYLKPLGINFKGGNPGNKKTNNIFDSLFPADEKI